MIKFIDKLFKPAIQIMNSFSFKSKIIVSTSILFILLVMPSHTTFTSYLSKNEIYNKQLIGLKYNRYINELIKDIQLHRGFSNAYLYGNKSFKKNILKIEDMIEKQISNLKIYDKNNLNILSYNKNFADALSSFEVVRFDTYQNRDPKVIFKLHSKIVDELIKVINDISVESSFSNSEDKRVNFLADMIQDKLPLLEENTGKLRGLVIGIFENKKITKKQKSELLSLYTLINSLKSYIVNNKMLNTTENYLDIQKNTALLSYKLKNILNIVNKNIMLTDLPSSYDSKRFFVEATSAISEQVKLYNLLSETYKNLINKQKNKQFYEFLLILLGFFMIIVTSVYVFGAFYYSVVKSIKKLHKASQMIAEGKKYVELKADTKDEIGEAIIAFNNMSKKLNQNISFLNGYKMAIDETSIVSKTDQRGIITYINKKFCEISGYTHSELVGHSHNIVRHPDMPKEAFKDLWKTIKSKKIWHGVVKNKKKDGGYYIVDATIIPVIDDAGKIVEYIGVRHDITELENKKEEIKRQKIDILTGLPNRRHLVEDLKSAYKPVVVYLNIDDFSSLNDFYGTKMGDKVIVHLGNILNKMAKDVGYKLYKFYSDEFVLLFENDKINSKNYVKILNNIIDRVEKDMLDCDSDSCVSILLSGGIAFYDEEKNKKRLIMDATIARKVAKSENKKFLMFKEEMIKSDDYAKNIKWINTIKEALEDNRIMTFFQPIIDNKTGAITKYESLVRLIDNEQKTVSPFFFLDIAKKAKLYTRITKVVIDKAFATFEKVPQYEFSVNITVEDIYDKDTANYIFEKLSRFSHPQNVIFEITESEEIKDYELVNTFTSKLKNLGAKIAIDDFGSGYANFEHIISLQADFIKIDGSLIKNIDKDENSRIITEAIIAFSKKLGSKTVVEYVHSREIFDIVKQMGADYSQGFYLGEPAPELKSLQKSVKEKEI